MSVTPEVASSNGHGAEAGGSAPPADSPLAHLRAAPENVHLLGGYGPLVVGIVLFVLMVTLAPTVAPERTVERPVDAPVTTTTSVPAEVEGATP
jgi:hypothetical protein